MDYNTFCRAYYGNFTNTELSSLPNMNPYPYAHGLSHSVLNFDLYPPRQHAYNYNSNIDIGTSSNAEINVSSFTVGKQQSEEKSAEGNATPNSARAGHSCAKEKSVRRRRTTFSCQQVAGLEQAYSHNSYADASERLQIARFLNLNEAQVKIWYQNRRAKDKREGRTIDRPDALTRFRKRPISPSSPTPMLSTFLDPPAPPVPVRNQSLIQSLGESRLASIFSINACGNTLKCDSTTAASVVLAGSLEAGAERPAPNPLVHLQLASS